jgi:hypothetical protein
VRDQADELDQLAQAIEDDPSQAWELQVGVLAIGPGPTRVSTAKADPVLIQSGDWSWTDQGEYGEEALLFNDYEIAFGEWVGDGAALRKLALDLMKLADMVANQAGSP